MICPRCKGEHVNIQVVQNIEQKKGKGCLYWLFIGWWFELIMWLFLTLPWLIIKIFKPKRYEQRTSKQAVCQNCGYSWKVN